MWSKMSSHAGKGLLSSRMRLDRCSIRVLQPTARSVMSSIKPPSHDMYAYNTPAFRKTKREDLADKWGAGLGFKIRPMNGHVKYTWKHGEWDQGVFVPAPYQLMHINAGALHYGISVFEGMKAFACKDGNIKIMRPEMNAMRMQRGADALLMPQVPEDMFVTGVMEAVRRNREFVPPYGNNASMYIRPLLFASGEMLGLAPLASEYTFFVTVMPAGSYFAAGAEEGVKAIVCEEHDRAAPKGTGGVKAAGNYAADLLPVHSAHKQGYGTTLYLDAKERRYVEEFSVANFVGITHDGVFVTPKSETILASTTNKMLQLIAQERGIAVEERAIDFTNEIENFKEVGMCGTAAVVVKVQSIARGDKVYNFPDFDTIASLRSALTSIQCGDTEDKHGWMADVCDVYDEALPSLPAISASSNYPSPTGMVSAEAKGIVRKLGPDAAGQGIGHERSLLQYIVQHAQPGDPDSVIASMESFWSMVTGSQLSDEWKFRSALIEKTVVEKVRQRKILEMYTQPMTCLELGTYCGSSTLLIAKNLPDNAKLLSVEKDELNAAIATKIIEFAGLDHKVKIWMGTVHTELPQIKERLEGNSADFVLVDHAKERFVPDLKLLNEAGVVDKDTIVMGDVDVYPGDDNLPDIVHADIKEYFEDHQFVLANMI